MIQKCKTLEKNVGATKCSVFTAPLPLNLLVSVRETVFKNMRSHILAFPLPLLLVLRCSCLCCHQLSARCGVGGRSHLPKRATHSGTHATQEARCNAELRNPGLLRSHPSVRDPTTTPAKPGALPKLCVVNKSRRCPDERKISPPGVLGCVWSQTEQTWHQGVTLLAALALSRVVHNII